MFPPLPWVLGYSGTPFVPLCHAVFPRNEVDAVEGPRINRSASCLSPTLAGVVAIQMRLVFVLRVCGVGRALANAEKVGVMLGGTGAWGSALAWRWSASTWRASAPAVGWWAPASLGDVGPSADPCRGPVGRFLTEGLRDRGADHL